MSLLTDAEKAALQAALSKSDGRGAGCIEAVRAIIGEPEAFAIATARWLLAQNERLTTALAGAGDRVPVTRDEMAALHHLSDYTHYLSDKASDGFFSLYNRCVVTPTPEASRT